MPWAIANAAFKRQRRNPGVTEIVKMPNRGHALTIDHGWHEVAQTALDFVERSLRNGGVPAGDGVRLGLPRASERRTATDL